MTEPFDRHDVVAAFEDDLDGFTALRNHQPTGRAQTLETPVAPVVTFASRKLHSGRDPLREAERFADGLALDSTQLVILLGYGSGHVARAIAERCGATIVVFEPNLEVLGVGLAHGPVPEQVSLVTQPARLGQLLYGLLRGSDKGIVVRWTPSLRADPRMHEGAMQRVTEAIDRANVRHRTARLRGPAWLRNYLENLPAVTQGPGLPGVLGRLRGVPAVIVAAGPSLDHNIGLLRTIGDNALVFAVNTAASALGRAGVTPTAVVAIESLDVSAQLATVPFVADVPAFLELTGNPAVWALPWRQRIPISVDTNSCSHFSRDLDPGFRMSAGFCVANTAVAIAHAMGCNPIILVGSDLAYTGDRVYASGTSFARMHVRKGADGYVELLEMEAKREIERRSGDAQLGNHAPQRTREMTAPAWDGAGVVTTSNEFMMFRDWYTFAAKTLREDGVQPINATEGGARIPGWDHLRLADAIERHGLAAPLRGTSVKRRLDHVLDAPALPPAVLHSAVVRERDTIARLLHIARAAPKLIAHGAEGPHSSKRNVKKLRRYNAEVRKLLHRSPLCSEACFVPIDDLRNAPTLDVDMFYGALARPLRQLDKGLARLLQRLGNELEREPRQDHEIDWHPQGTTQAKHGDSPTPGLPRTT